MSQPEESSKPSAFTRIDDLALAAEPPGQGGILSRTIHQDARTKVVVFGFAAGEELSEHTAAVPAILQVARGEFTLRLGDEESRAGPGTWVHMSAGLRHALRAETPAVLLLVLLKG